MAIVTLKITGGRNDKIAQFYSCGKPGDEFYAKAQEIMGQSDSDAVCDFIKKNFGEPDVEMFVHGLDDDGCLSVRVEDGDGGVVFESERYGDATQRGFILADPREWEFDGSMGEYQTSAIRKLVEASGADIEEAIASWRNDRPGEDFDSSFGDDYLCDVADGVASMIVQAPFVEAGFEMNSYYLKSDRQSPEAFFATMCADLYGNGEMTCGIELAEGEVFDPDKLKLILNDYDGFYYACADSVLPVVMYGNKFHRLTRDSWETHYEYFGFAKKGEGGTCFEFSGEDF